MKNITLFINESLMAIKEQSNCDCGEGIEYELLDIDKELGSLADDWTYLIYGLKDCELLLDDDGIYTVDSFKCNHSGGPSKGKPFKKGEYAVYNIENGKFEGEFNSIRNLKDYLQENY